jgi:hypothetical protein
LEVLDKKIRCDNVITRHVVLENTPRSSGKPT